MFLQQSQRGTSRNDNQRCIDLAKVLIRADTRQRREEEEEEEMEEGVDGSTDDIESIMEDMEYIPGFFHLELNLNGDPTGPAELRQRDTHLRLDGLRAEAEAESGYLRYAVRNLLGFLAFHLEQLEEAEERFR